MMRVIPLLVLFSLCAPAFARAERTPERSEIHFAIPGPGVVLESSFSGQSLRRDSAGPDTFDIYGGPTRRLRDPDGIPGNGDEYVEGKFEDAGGLAPRGLSPNPGDWTGVDLTDQEPFWSVDTFNAANLNGNGVGNRAMWAGLPAGVEQSEGWSKAPGYGNDWFTVLQYESEPLADPSIGQTVQLDFVFNLDTESDYDFLRVEYERNGTWEEVYSESGSSRDPLTGQFEAPGWTFATRPGVLPIVYSGNDYGEGDRIRIRLVFMSDSAFSDEDGLIDTDGAVQLDDFVLTTSQSTFTEDFEGAGPFLFRPVKQPFAGDFAHVFSRLTDIDVCGENRTPQLAFIDFGQEPPNGPGTTGRTSTGGSTSPTWNYGNGFVVNYSGGLDGVPLHNAAVSPEVEWDLPGTEDDGAEFYGTTIEVTLWEHNPLSNGFFWFWDVRGFANGVWSPWDNDQFYYYLSATPRYTRLRLSVSHRLPAYPEKVQLRLGVVDLAAAFGFPGTDATPAPYYDDVRIAKVRVGGISLSTRSVDLANDAFPLSGSINASTAAARDALDVRFDMARDVSSGDMLASGDSVIVNATAVIPGTSIQQLVMKWSLRQNPLFDDPGIRVAPAGPFDADFASAVDAGGRTVWSGSVSMQPSTTATGIPIEDTYFADLPDEDFLYPGDLLHYYFEATDSDGRVTTLPTDTSGFGTWDAEGRSAYSRTYTVRALPTLTDASGAQPSLLVWNDFGRRGGEDEYAQAFTELGLIEGVDWDSYTTQGPSSGVSNGLGAAAVNGPLGRRGHGATVDQIAGYQTLVYFAGSLDTQLLSDGTNSGLNDKGADLLLLTAWKDLPGPRASVYFGDFVASAPTLDSPTLGAQYVTDAMGVELVSADVRSRIGGQTTPIVRPTGNAIGLDTAFLAYGGCFGINQFDAIRPLSSAFASHGFVNPSTDQLYTEVAAGVIHDRRVDGDRKVDVTFPFGFVYVWDPPARRDAAVSTRAQLLGEVLQYVGVGGVPGGSVVSAPSARRASLALFPSPFNPSTQVHFALPRAGMDASVVVFDVRGQRVRTLHDGAAATADLRLEWNGRDDLGQAVASGIYLVKAVTTGFVDTRKAVLVK